MALVRGKHKFDGHFTQIPNEWLRDNRLTFRARGLLAQIMSNASGFHLSIAGLAAQNREGKDAIRAAIAELEKFGYLKRDQKNDGRFGESVWETCDPVDLADFPTTEKPTTENPTPKNNNIKNIEIKNTNNKNNNDLFEKFWDEYPRKRDRGPAMKAFASALKRTSFEKIMDGLTRYKNDPTRKPEFTKYPATWLNADGWENDYNSPANVESRAQADARREKERQATKDMLNEFERAKTAAAPPPKCEHDNNPALCIVCLRGVR